MKNARFIGALCALTFCIVGAAVYKQPQLLQLLGKKSGYDLFLEARALIQDGPNGEPLTEVKLAPTENLRRQRLGTARNAPALAKLREALKAGITRPLPENDADFPVDFPVSASARKFARLLAQEAAVRAADGDAASAAQSNVDSLELGAQMSHGSLLDNLAGIAIAAIGRAYLEKYVPSLDAAQSREVARQLDEIGARMQTMPQMLQAEEISHKATTRRLFADMDDPQKRAKLEANLNVGPAEYNQAAKAMLALPLAQVETEYQTQFARVLALADKPYFVATRTPISQSNIAYVNLTMGTIAGPSSRLWIERDKASNRLLADSLRLHALKLERGQYPETFDAEADPFSPNLSPMIYRRAGDSYVLYSVGPDGKNDNGAKIQTVINGTTIVDGLLMFNSTGDIVAPVL